MLPAYFRMKIRKAFSEKTTYFFTFINRYKNMIKIYYFQQKGDISAFIFHSKMTRIMKLTSLLLILSIGLAFASNSYAQKSLLSMNMIDRTVLDVLEEIETQTEYHFFYNSKMIDLHRTVSVNVKDKPVFTTS